MRLPYSEKFELPDIVSNHSLTCAWTAYIMHFEGTLSRPSHRAIASAQESHHACKLFETTFMHAQVSCPGQCTDEVYCSKLCADAAWEQHHQLLCCGPDDAGQLASAGPSATACR